jgi:ABC-2 type transport system ATP-binding protein
VTTGVRELTVRFGHRVALDGVTLDVPAGAVTAVVGGDGAGKTTLLRALVGLVAPSSGEVRRPDDRQIGYLPSSSGTYPDLSVDENLAFTATVHGLAADEVRRRAAGYLERTGLAAAHDRLAGNLSGGMRRKLGVVRALLHRPELVVLDEPTTGVDPVSRADLWWLIAGAAAEGAAVVLATTYLDEAERAGLVLALDAGHPLATGTPAEIVAAMPGTITTRPDRPTGPAAARSWRRRGRWHTWTPTPATTPTNPAPTGAGGGPGGVKVDGGAFGRVDLQDAVTVAILAREVGGG